MRWRLTVALDLIAGTIALLSALALGNVLVGSQAASLRGSTSPIARAIVHGELAPDNVAEWLLSRRPAWWLAAMLVGALCFEAILLAWIVRRSRPAAGGKAFRRAYLKLVAKISGVFVIGAVAGGAAWAAIALFNGHRSGVLAWSTVVVGLLICLFVIEFARAAVDAVGDAERAFDAYDDAATLDRRERSLAEGGTQGRA